MANLLTPLAIWIGRQEWTMRNTGVLVRLDRGLTRATRGHVPLLRLAGLDELTLHVPGRKSGVERSTPLLQRRWGGGHVIVGSNWGSDTPPLWVKNLRAAADGTVAMTIDGQRTGVEVVELDGARRDEAWQAAIDQWPNYEIYRHRTQRVLPVFLLTPRS